MKKIIINIRGVVIVCLMVLVWIIPGADFCPEPNTAAIWEMVLTGLLILILGIALIKEERIYCNV
jgi:hypothetical protein